MYGREDNTFYNIYIYINTRSRNCDEGESEKLIAIIRSRDV